MGSDRTLAVTGASGHLGRRVVELLLEARAGRVVAASRHPEKLADLAQRGAVVRRADLDDPKSLADAFAGVGRLLLVSTDALDRPGRRLEQHGAAVLAARLAGVEHVVYTSCPHPEPGSPLLIAVDHWGTEQMLAASGMSWTALRNNLYMDLLLGFLSEAVARGELVAAAGESGAAYVTREDCARAAAAALASSGTRSQALEITGPAVVTFRELARITGELTGRAVSYVPVYPAALRAGMVGAGMPEAVVDLLLSFQAGMVEGRLGPATTAFVELTGRRPTSVAEFLAARRPLLVPTH